MDSEHVTVVVLGSSIESISIAERVAWLREDVASLSSTRVQGILDDLPVDYGNDEVWKGHIALMRLAISQADAENPFPPLDAVFSSENYGLELGRRLGVEPIVLDTRRIAFPISGSAARRSVAGHWKELPPASRAGLCLRIVILGAESTGTTTLCQDLCSGLRTRGGSWSETLWVPEYGREFSEEHVTRLRIQRPEAMPQDLNWSEADFIQIAQEQTRREREAAKTGGPYLILDTDALATGLWHERYRGQTSQALRDFAATLPHRDLYVLTSPQNIAFDQDGLRDGEHLRDEMHRRFREVLADCGFPWIEVVGSRHERMQTVLAKADTLAIAKWTFSSPLPERNKP
jgi:HTH-type transcriptional regulator, transcriptional repressor of NAD biosynthesis genes